MRGGGAERALPPRAGTHTRAHGASLPTWLRISRKGRPRPGDAALSLPPRPGHCAPRPARGDPRISGTQSRAGPDPAQPAVTAPPWPRAALRCTPDHTEPSAAAVVPLRKGSASDIHIVSPINNKYIYMVGWQEGGGVGGEGKEKKKEKRKGKSPTTHQDQREAVSWQRGLAQIKGRLC